MNKFKKYLKALSDFYEEIGYEESWHIYPIEDYTEYYWFILTDNIHSPVLYFGYDPNTLNSIEDDDNFICPIITLPDTKYIYKTSELTAVLLDTQVDGNDVLAVLDNTKKVESKLI